MFFRGKHQTQSGAPVDMKAGMAMHLVLSSMQSSWRRFNADHIVYCMEGRSWRKNVYPEYKYNRKLVEVAKSESEKEEDEILFAALNDLNALFIDKTNVSTLHNPNAEADDLIGIFCQMHPDDRCVVVSTDSDFVQLLKHDNVVLFNPVAKTILTKHGVTNLDGKNLEFEVLSNSKLKIKDPNESFKPQPDWYEYALFLKIIRGDKGDNIFSAYPGARVKGSKKTIGIREAFEDRHSKGYMWNNFMLQTWVDVDEVEHKVKDKYAFNMALIDLECQPDDVMESCINTIKEATQKPRVQNIGFHFMKFCGLYALNRIGDNAETFTKMLNAPYEK